MNWCIYNSRIEFPTSVKRMYRREICLKILIIENVKEFSLLFLYM